MTQKLVTLTGPAAEQAEKAEFLNISNLEAGVKVLEAIGNVFPELSFNDFRPENWHITKKLLKDEVKFSGPCTGCQKMGHCKAWHPHHCDWGNTGDDIGNRLNDVASFIGDNAGDAIRLLTDEEVLDGAIQIGSAIATSGGSVGFSELMESLAGDGGAGDVINSILGRLGGKAKSDIDAAAFSFKDIPKEALYIGGGLIGIVLLISIINR